MKGPLKGRVVAGKGAPAAKAPVATAGKGAPEKGAELSVVKTAFGAFGVLGICRLESGGFGVGGLAFAFAFAAFALAFGVLATRRSKKNKRKP